MAKEKTIKNKIPGGVTGAVEIKIFTTSQNNNFTKIFTPPPLEGVAKAKCGTADLPERQETLVKKLKKLFLK